MTMTVPTTMLPSLGQWRLINLLAIRAAFTAERRASRMLDRANCEPADLGELAEEGWVTGHNKDGDDVILAENWHHSLAHVWLHLTAKGLGWAANNPHNTLLFEIADAQGAYRMKPAEVKDKDEVLQQLDARRLVEISTESGAPVLTERRPPSVECPGEVLYIRLTHNGRLIVSP
jgi:hypothetical protein